MYVLVAYDVNTQTPEGKTRLRKVAKKCVAYGQRVQNSVFECKLDSSQYLTLKCELKNIIDYEKDSIRFYNLGKNYLSKLETLGNVLSYNPDDILML